LRFEVVPARKKPQIAIKRAAPAERLLAFPELHLDAGQHYRKKHPRSERTFNRQINAGWPATPRFRRPAKAKHDVAFEQEPYLHRRRDTEQ
jgi:hypothetical protein